MTYHIATKCLYGNGTLQDTTNTGSLVFPIYQTATFAHPAVGESTGYDYSRLQNPTRQRLEEIIASLENGIDALAFSSGMAAITAMMELFCPGDHILVSNDLYGGTIRLFDNISQKNQIEIDYMDSDFKDAEHYIKTNTKAIYLETPTNPMMNVTDIRAVAEIAQKLHLLLIVDNTFLTPYFQNPLDLGADIVIHSGTKFLGGHNDALAGFLVVKTKELSEKLRFIIKTVGSGLSPFDSWLILRGIKTLPLRMERGQENAIAIADWLQKQSKVKKVYYTGLPSHSGYEISRKQSRGFGCMLTFQVDSKETALSILKNVKMIHFAESLGGVETLITYPTTQTHADVPEKTRLKNGITDETLRISVGIENIDDLIADLNQALNQ